jgi:hypothetical protein
MSRSKMSVVLLSTIIVGILSPPLVQAACRKKSCWKRRGAREEAVAQRDRKRGDFTITIRRVGDCDRFYGDVRVACLRAVDKINELNAYNSIAPTQISDCFSNMYVKNFTPNTNLVVECRQWDAARQ